MKATRHRPYAGPSDLRAMKRLLIANWRAGHDAYHRGDLDWWLFPGLNGAPEAGIELWFTAEGECAGWVFLVEAQVDCDVVTHPDWRGSRLEREMFRWADSRLAAAARRLGKTRVCAYCFADQDIQREILSELGYVEADDVILYSQPLAQQPLPSIPLPLGFRWLPPLRVEWAAARAAAHADAFRPSRMTPAAYRRFMRDAPDYRGELDIVAVAPDGQHAAFAMAWLDEEIPIGLFEPVGTRHEYQRRGLGRAVLREGLRRMQARGMSCAMVGCDADNEGNQAFYRAAGFREHTRILSCRRELVVKSGGGLG